jgi:Tol biopolymer transport system component
MLCLNIYPVSAKAPTTPKIVFTTARDGNREIYIMNPDGSDQVRLTNHRADDAMPTWSPTGEHILFASDRDRFTLSRDLYLMDPDGKNVRRVFGKSEDRSNAAWSPDGKRIAYRRRELNGAYIYIGTIDGKKEERVAIGGSPTWSPDGTEIAFLSGFENKQVQINILNVRTKKQKALFPRKAKPSWINGTLVWSLTTDKLAFSWNPGAEKKNVDMETLYTLNSDGSGLKRITSDAAPRETSPIWSPQGDALLYDKADKHNRLQVFKIVLGSDVSEQLTDTFIPQVFGKFFQANSPGDWFDPAYALPVAPQPQLLTTQWGEVKTK